MNIVNRLAWAGFVAGLALCYSSSASGQAVASAYGGLAEAPKTSGDMGGSTAAADAGDSGEGGHGFGVGQASFANLSAQGSANSSPETNYSGGGTGEWGFNDHITFDGTDFPPPVSSSQAEFFFYVAWKISGNARINISLMNQFISVDSKSGLVSSLDLENASKGGTMVKVTAPFSSVDFISEPANFSGAIQESWAVDAQAFAGGLGNGGSVGASQAFASITFKKVEVFNSAQRIPGPMIAMTNPQFANAPNLPSADFDPSGGGGIDGADFLIWQRNLGLTSGATPSTGDANGDGRVDEIDLIYWDIQYGGVDPNVDPGAVATVATVPEPNAAVIAILSAVVALAPALSRRGVAVKVFR